MNNKFSAIVYKGHNKEIAQLAK